MVRTYGKNIKLNKAPDFDLIGVDDKKHSLQSCKGPKGLLVMFICCHCPYVKAIIERLNSDCEHLKSHYGIGTVAIMPNDTVTYPEDSFENMKKFSKDYNLSFPFVLDESQEVAKSYDAVCTPEFFGFNSEGKLCYHGRFDDSAKERKQNAREDRDLFKAMKYISEHGHSSENEDIMSIGCSIKWLDEGNIDAR